MKITKKRIIIAILLICIIGGYISYKTKSNNTNTIDVITPVNKDDIILEYESNGEVESKKEAIVFSNVSGNVEKVNFNLWDEVKKGDVLLTLDQKSVNSAKNTLEKYKIELNQKKKDYENTLEIYKLKGVSLDELNRVKDAYNIAKIEYNEAYNNLSDIKSEIVSPVSGVITESNVDENLKIDPTKSLFKIVDVENLHVVINIPNSMVKNIKVGHNVEITSDSLDENEKINAKITEISKISFIDKKFNDSVTKVGIKIDSKSGLKPGDSVSVKIIYKENRNVIVVGMQDILRDDKDNLYTFIVENKKVKKVDLVLGDNNGIKYEVKSGLKEGDQVINNLGGKYKDGDELK